LILLEERLIVNRGSGKCAPLEGCGGTGFWIDQRAPRVSEISAARTGESAGGKEDDLRHAKSAETLPLRMEFPECLKELAQSTKLLFPAGGPMS
jgi:hypothetical protein